jgi:hypothetical protein
MRSRLERMMGRHEVTWHGSGKGARMPSDPRYPAGTVVDRGGVLQRKCKVRLRYPAPEVGFHEIVCLKCRNRVLVTAAGRRDDPHTVMVPCKGR